MQRELGRIVLVEERIVVVADVYVLQRDLLGAHRHPIREYLGSGETGRIVVEEVVARIAVEGVVEHIAVLRMD